MRPFHSFIVIVLFFVGFLPASSQASETHPFTVHDMVAMQRLSEPSVSPDGRFIVFTVRTTDFEADTGRTDLWMVGIDGSGLRRMTTHPAADYSPQWSTDGKAIYFLSTRSGSAQVWKISKEGGEAVPVTQLPLDVNGFKVSPKGTHLLLALDVFPECENVACTADRLKERSEKKAKGVVYDSLFVRHWDTWADGRRSHLFSFDPQNPDPIDLMKGMNADSPSKPFGGMEEITFTPDGRYVIFTARDSGREEAWSTNFDLFWVPVDASQSPRNLTKDNPAWDTQPVFSPDGRTLAYLAMNRPGYESDRYRIILKSWPDGPSTILSEDWDRSPSSLDWSPDGKFLLVTAENLGQKALFAIDAKTGTPQSLIKEGYVSAFKAIDKFIVYLLDHLKAPAELYRVDFQGRHPVKLTQFNDDRLKNVEMGDFEQFSFPGWNGETVHGFVVYPVGFQRDRKYPIAFLIHGGPQGSFNNHFHYRWNPQVYGGAGYGVVMIDFHGSTGYGQAFTDSIRGDWGGKPLIDLQLGLEAAIQRFPWLDGQRVCALGASYGGYMINWIAGQWPDRFRCLVNHDGLFDQRTMYYVTEELWFPEWEQGGPYFENPDSHEKFNPSLYVKNWKTPMLVIHGAQDYRVPLEQGLATFTALQRRGIPSRFLYFPNENHWVLKPSNSILWHDTVLAWLKQWLQSKPGETPMP